MRVVRGGFGEQEVSTSMIPLHVNLLEVVNADCLPGCKSSRHIHRTPAK
jgi:hypothetical protein